MIDWAEAGLGIPSMDFIGLADFSKKKSDQFLKEILEYYDYGQNLFSQIKENAIIDVMNWFWWYEKNNDDRGIDSSIRKLKRWLT